MSKYAPLRRTANGRMLCNAHAYSGAPRFHTEGCEMCAKARAKGIVRPDADKFTASERRAAGFHAKTGEHGPNPKEDARKRKARKAMAEQSRETMPRRECA